MAEAPASHTIRYRLAWNARRTTAAPDGGVDLVTDRGIRVHVARGWLCSYSMELVECPRAAPLAWLLSPRAAWAWHSADMVNPATVRSAPIESLTALRTVDAGEVRLPPQDYCQVHYLIARATTASRGLPTAVDMVDRSLIVEGTAQPAAGGPPVPFAIATASPNALLRPIAPVDVGTHDLLVVVRRDLGRLFDGIDFGAMRPAVIENRLVENLVRRARVKVRPLD